MFGNSFSVCLYLLVQPLWKIQNLRGRKKWCHDGRNQKLAKSTESLLFFPHIFNPMFTRLIAGFYFTYSSYCAHSQQVLNIGCLNTVTCYLHITPTGAALSWKPVSWSSRRTVFFADVNARGGLSLCSHWVFASATSLTFMDRSVHTVAYHGEQSFQSDSEIKTKISLFVLKKE